MRNAFRMISLFAICCGLVFHISGDESNAQEPGWYPYVIARGPARAQIRQTPIQYRPYRPMHFYGNTQRRIQYRGTPLPQISDLRRTTRNRVFRRF